MGLSCHNTSIVRCYIWRWVTNFAGPDPSNRTQQDGEVFLSIVFQTFNRAEATHRVHITQNIAEAHLAVLVTNNRSCVTQEELWFITGDWCETSSKVFMTNKADSEISVYFVHNRTQAGWKKERPRIRRL